VLPTFVIGLREGLEAALIVSIVATFLRRNGASLRGLWIGVGAGVGLSFAVGIVLRLVEQSLPQAKQEAMETVIGLVAVFFVTGMVFWMRTHARFMKRELESAAADALKSGTTTALAVMAFLAVLREGFETAVFLLATFQSASSAPAAVFGAFAGIMVAIGLGWGIYRGGVRLNLQRFFSITGFFLILVAAGLVLSAFRTGHEAGWVTVGQGHTVDLSWLAPNGSIQAALISGVLGIPRDPRVIEVIAWLAYLVPLLLITFLPPRLRPGQALAQRLRVAGAAVALVGAVVLLFAVPSPKAVVPASAPVEGGGTATIAVHGHTATLTEGGRSIQLTGEDGHWTGTHAAGSLPATLSLTDLLGYTGHRVPVGIDVRTAIGPFRATWSDRTAVSATTYGDGLVDARAGGRLVLTLSGGGLSSPRAFSVDAATWQVEPAHAAATRADIADAQATAHDRLLWSRWAPVALLLTALLLLGQAYRHHSRRASLPVQQAPETKGSTTHADSLA
jgi:high-affinity iron transporter